MKPPHSPWALSLAMLLGAAIAGFGVVFAGRPTPVEPPPTAIALVNGTPIPRADYERAVAALEADLRRPIDARDRQHVIDKLVDELLLVEHGLALELPQRDPYLRTQIARAVLDRVTARVETTNTAPSTQLLREHLRAHPERFVASARVEVAGLFVAGTDPQRARTLAQRWRDDPSQALAPLEAAADPAPLELPRGPLPAAKLRDYIGAGATAQLLELEPGAISEPIAVDGGTWVLRLVARTHAEPPAFEQLREQLAADLERELEDQAVEQLLVELREAATIQIAPP